MTDLRVSQVTAEVLEELPAPDLRVSSVTAEVLTALPAPDLRISQVTAEVLTALPAPDLRISEVYAEVLVPYNPYEELAAVVAATTTIPTPTVGVGGDTTVNAAVVPAVAAVTGHTPSAGATKTAAVVTATTSIPAPTVSAGGAITVTPPVVPAVTTVPAPTVSDGTTPVTINPGVVPAVAAVPAPVVTGVNGTPPNTGQGGVFDTQDGNVPAFDGSGDTFIVAAPKSSFVLTYVPINYSEHITVSVPAGTSFRKLQRGTQWTIAGKELQLRGDLEEVFVGAGPWRLEAQYAYGGAGDSGEIPEGDPPPDIDDPPPTVPPPAGAILYGSSPNGASGGSKSSIVAYVNSIFGGLNILRAFDDSPTAWGDTRTAQFQPMPSVVCISLKPGLANLAGGGAAKEKVKAFLRTIPASIPAVYITCHHEPENDTSAIPAGDANTGPLYKRMMAVFLAAVDEVRAEGKCQNVYTMSILMSFSILHRNPEDWYVAGVDVLGWDTYNRANLTALRNYSISKGKPWMVCEIGCKPVANYTDAQYADELEAMFNIWTTGATLPIAVCYFQSTVGDNYVITPETRPISTAWWRTLVTTGNPP